MPRISLRVLDADMFKSKCHPILLTRDELTVLLLDSTRVHEHVKHIVETKLCTSECVLLPQRPGCPYSKKISPLQYITRQYFKTSDDRFNHKVKTNLVNFIVATFFNQQYIERIMAFKDVASTQVNFSSIHAFPHHAHGLVL